MKEVNIAISVTETEDNSKTVFSIPRKLDDIKVNELANTIVALIPTNKQIFEKGDLIDFLKFKEEMYWGENNFTKDEEIIDLWIDNNKNKRSFHNFKCKAEICNIILAHIDTGDANIDSIQNICKSVIENYRELKKEL